MYKAIPMMGSHGLAINRLTHGSDGDDKLFVANKCVDSQGPCTPAEVVAGYNPFECSLSKEV